MEEENVSKQVKEPMKISLVGGILLFMTCAVISLGALYLIFN